MTEDNQKLSWQDDIAEDLADPVSYHMEWNGRTTDWFLQQQVILANRKAMSVGITLFTAGGMVTGQLIGVEEYFQLYAETFSAAFHEDQRESIRESYAANGKRGVHSNPDEAGPSPQFIHLKNARASSPSGMIPTSTGFLWRGSIASISGFALGSLTG